MRRFRNPRYAPEALERKLHPSGPGIPVTAEFTAVSTLAVQAIDPAATSVDPPPTIPAPHPTDPAPGNPWEVPSPPSDPDEPNR